MKHDIGEIGGECSDQEAAVLTGLNVRGMREIRGWSQVELARMTGLSRTTIRRIEEGMPAWRPTLEKIAQAFNVPLAEVHHTTRFQNVLGAGTPFLKHDSRSDFWHAFGDKRTQIPSNNTQLIQSVEERRRLGRLGFVPLFASGMDFFLPEGPGINRIELYGRMPELRMPQFKVNIILGLAGRIMLAQAGRIETIGPGEAIALMTEKPFALEPAEAPSMGVACEALFMGASRQKVTERDSIY